MRQCWEDPIVAAGRFAEVVNRLWPDHGEGDFDVAAREAPWIEPPVSSAQDCPLYRFALAVHPKERYWEGPLSIEDEKCRRDLKVALDRGVLKTGLHHYLHYLKLLPYWEVALGDRLRANWPCREVDSATTAALRVRALDFDGLAKRSRRWLVIA